MEDQDKTLPQSNFQDQDKTLFQGNPQPQDNFYAQSTSQEPMFIPAQNNVAGNFPPSGTFPPANTPQKPKRSRPKTLLILGGVIVLLIILGVGGFVFLPKGNSQATPPTATPTTLKNKKVSPYAVYLKQYGPTIKAQIAQGLHLTAAQVGEQLSAGNSIDAIAQAQNVSAEQLNTLIASAYQNGLQPVVQSGQLTQQQVTTLIKHMQANHKALANFLVVGFKKRKLSTATPTA